MSSQARRFLELAVHVKLASEAMIAAARDLAVLRPPEATSPAAAAWLRMADGLFAMNVQIGLMEQVLRGAVREAYEERAERDVTLA